MSQLFPEGPAGSSSCFMPHAPVCTPDVPFPGQITAYFRKTNSAISREIAPGSNHLIPGTAWDTVAVNGVDDLFILELNLSFERVAVTPGNMRFITGEFLVNGEVISEQVGQISSSTLFQGWSQYSFAATFRTIPDGLPLQIRFNMRMDRSTVNTVEEAVHVYYRRMYLPTALGEEDSNVFGEST